MADNPTGTGAGKGTGLQTNVASMLSYICAPFTSIAFMLLEKENKEVQFHAWQGIIFGVVAFAVAVVVKILVIILLSISGFLGYFVNSIIFPIIGIAFVIVWIICVIKAYQGERWKIPYIGDIAEKKASGM